MRNIGTANNTIIHECVHWDRHKRAFELQSILEGGAKHISCEIVEGEYNGIGPNESALKWMEWQANQLAPRILMPAKTTKWLFNKYIAEEHTSNPHRRYAETLQETVGRVANYFQVSLLAAKLRLFELGFKEVEGVFVYCDGMMLPPYAFHKDVLDKNHSFVVDEENLLRALVTNNRLMELYCKGAIVYANSILMETADDNNVLVENSNSETGSFALLFEFDGDVRKIKHLLYNCSASRPSIESSTNEESKEVQTETLTIKARPLANGYVKAKTGDTTTAETYNNWYSEVYMPAVGTA